MTVVIAQGKVLRCGSRRQGQNAACGDDIGGRASPYGGESVRPAGSEHKPPLSQWQENTACTQRRPRHVKTPQIRPTKGSVPRVWLSYRLHWDVLQRSLVMASSADIATHLRMDDPLVVGGVCRRVISAYASAGVLVGGWFGFFRPRSVPLH